MNLNKIITQKFTASFMNNTKWRKLIKTLTYEFDDLFVHYKLITEDKFREAFLFDDYQDWFLEPITFKEVEWICFPKEYEIIHNKRITRKIIKQYSQDLDAVETCINKVGHFMLYKTNSELTLYAYR